nr:uncharacterized protein LOC127295401 [Lolium perenne]
MKVEVHTVAGERGGRADPRRRAGAGWRAHHIVTEPRWWRRTVLSTWIRESAHEHRPFPSTMKGMHHLVYTSKMNLSDEVDLEEYVSRLDTISVADKSRVCEEMLSKRKLMLELQCC